MDVNQMLIAAAIILISNLLTYFIVSKKAKAKLSSCISEYKDITEGITESKKELASLANNTLNAKEEHTIAMSEYAESLADAKEELSVINDETQELQILKTDASKLAEDVELNTAKLSTIIQQIEKMTSEEIAKGKDLHELMAKLDLYTRIDEFVENGHFEMPEYLYETSARFVEEIKRVREDQKNLIKIKSAVTYPISIVIVPDKAYNKSILEGQVKLMLASFNIECDSLIGKVTPSTFPRTLERIEKIANSLEKSAATLHCGFNMQYVNLKYEECQLQYQNSLKRKEEQDEQRLIREQIREEQKAIKEYERAIAQAEKEEKMYRELLDKARQELDKVSDEDRIIAEQRIADLEAQLAEAESKEERAKSMAEQTRKGHVYVISNIGSFGEEIYKIGLTRRLEPMDRVKELGDASVPFTFDVHAMIYVDDAPALESALHREFNTLRVNAVNHRKEFFKVDLLSIKNAVEKIAGIEAEFTMTALAEDYYETRRFYGGNSQA